MAYSVLFDQSEASVRGAHFIFNKLIHSSSGSLPLVTLVKISRCPAFVGDHVRVPGHFLGRRHRRPDAFRGARSDQHVSAARSSHQYDEMGQAGHGRSIDDQAETGHLGDQPAICPFLPVGHFHFRCFHYAISSDGLVIVLWRSWNGVEKYQFQATGAAFFTHRYNQSCLYGIMLPMYAMLKAIPADKGGHLNGNGGVRRTVEIWQQRACIIALNPGQPRSNGVIAWQPTAEDEFFAPSPR